MRRLAPSLTLLLASAVALACGGGEPAPDTGSRDAAEADAAGNGAAATGAEAAPTDSARMLAAALMDWQGGEEAWEATRFLRFDWIVERDGELLGRRSHAWDRFDGEYRLSFRRPGERGDTARVVALFDVQTIGTDTVSPRGDVWVDGRRLRGAARDSALQNAYGAFINDSYWLLMPLKWRDPGVHLEYEGPTRLPDGERYLAVHLTFEEDLGITNDQYWGFVQPETGRMAAWRFHLQGQEQKGPVIWWRDWQRFGPQELKLALDRRWAEGTTHIYFENVAADTVVPADVFAPPSE